MSGVASEDKPTFQSLIDQEVLDNLTPSENAVIIEAASLFMKKRNELMAVRGQEESGYAEEKAQF